MSVPDPKPGGEAALKLLRRKTQVVLDIDVGSVAVGVFDSHFRPEKHDGSRGSELPLVVEVIAIVLGEKTPRSRHACENGEGSENTVKQ
jgi:hypothetical protein